MQTTTIITLAVGCRPGPQCAVVGGRWPRSEHSGALRRGGRSAALGLARRGRAEEPPLWPGSHRQSQIDGGRDDGVDYKDLKNVRFLAIYEEKLFSKKKSYLSYHEMRDINTQENDLNSFKFIFLELSKFKDKKEDLKTITQKWAYFSRRRRGCNRTTTCWFHRFQRLVW